MSPRPGCERANKERSLQGQFRGFHTKYSLTLTCGKAFCKSFNSSKYMIHVLSPFNESIIIDSICHRDLNFSWVFIFLASNQENGRAVLCGYVIKFIAE